jgi:hypothetical protein
MNSSNERIREVLATYLEYLEMGGSEPETSHLTPEEKEELDRLIKDLTLTEGIPFGIGREDRSTSADWLPPGGHIREARRSDVGETLLAELREAMPLDARLGIDHSPVVASLGDFSVLGRWVVGTFGGRIRVWLLDVESADQLEDHPSTLDELNRVFRGLPDTAAIALVSKDLSCLLVEPEDCAPQIQVPGGSLVGRRYRGPVQHLPEAVRGFMSDLVPYWDPVPDFSQDAGLVIDAASVTDEFVREAVEEQISIGQRARRGNPKKDALLGLGNREVAGLKRITDQLLQQELKPQDIESRLQKLAKRP